jgi:hypothetical protein
MDMYHTVIFTTDHSHTAYERYTYGSHFETLCDVISFLDVLDIKNWQKEILLEIQWKQKVFLALNILPNQILKLIA